MHQHAFSNTADAVYCWEKGVKADKAIEEVGMVVEGISTAEAAEALAHRYNIEMPITEKYALSSGAR